MSIFIFVIIFVARADITSRYSELFNIILTVHLRIILVGNQLDANVLL
jgi:hypothetical protein